MARVGAALAAAAFAVPKALPQEVTAANSSGAGAERATSAEPKAPARFQLMYPLTTVPPVLMDMELNGKGLAMQIARARRLQARILWIDCTANIDRYNTAEKVAGVVAKAAASGFNTLVFDVKPISGQVAYASKVAPKLLEWKGQKLPPDFDPLAAMVREAKAKGLALFVSMNAFSEGHRDFKVGPGYATPNLQTVLYEPRPLVRVSGTEYLVYAKSNEPPPNELELGVVTLQARIPAPKQGQFGVSVSRTGLVVDGFEMDERAPAPTIPQGGSLLVGTGRSADFLRQNALPGRPLAYVSKPLFVPISERPEQQVPLMMNPNYPEVRRRALAILREVVSNYAVDGVAFDDRLRYAGLNADFSEFTRAEFEKRMGEPLKWPDDVMKYSYSPGFVRGVAPGPFYQQWLNFRAETLQSFVAEARKVVEAARKDAQFGVYAGSWYGEYASYGSNYGAQELEAGFWYLTPEYRKTGFAPLLDFLITGCYYQVPTIHQALTTGQPIGFTVEFAGYLSNQVARDQTWTYAGIMLSQFKDDTKGLTNALQAACGSTQGVMVFDLSHGIEPFWEVFAQAFRVPAKAPHSDRVALRELRYKRSMVDKATSKRTTVVIATGQAGTGH